MIGIHLQHSTRDWPATANTLADGGYGHGKVTKLLFGVERALEVTSGQVIYRWVGHQPLPFDNFEDHAERWIRQFVDESFLKVAHKVHFINGYNETLANSQGVSERARWIALHTAMAKVWKERFRDVEPRLAHIRLIMCETAVGNDIPVEIAAASVRYDAILGYHPYMSCDHLGPVVPDTKDSGINRPPYISPHDWRWYSGRWDWMDKLFVAAGLKVTWAFGEMGAVLDASHTWAGWLDPLGGWKSCLGGDLNRYNEAMNYWLTNATMTDAYHEDRIIGGVLFTSGAPGGSGGQWNNFELREGDLNTVIHNTNNFPYPKKTGVITPPPPPPPEPSCKVRVQYRREYRCMPQETLFDEYMAVCAEAFWDRSTVGFSYDDAGIGLLDDKTAMLFGIPPEDVPNFADWFAEYYPGTKLDTKVMPFIGRNPDIKLNKPLAGEHEITQVYGENYQRYMERYNMPGHNGIDYAAPLGTPVYFSERGSVAFKGFDANGYGHYVIADHGDSVQTIYAHLSEASPLPLGGQYSPMDSLGITGNSGWSTGAHLHFGIRVDGRWRDPQPWII